jgi:hypothetical protein
MSDKENVKYKLPKNFVVKFSQRASMMINNLKDFDKQDFLNWMFNDFIIGNSTVLEYLEYKEAKKAKKKE